MQILIVAVKLIQDRHLTKLANLKMGNMLNIKHGRYVNHQFLKILKVKIRLTVIYNFL